MSSSKKVGLALGSGAYRGFAHIGVIKSLKKNKIPIDYLSGCSAGAWIAAYYAAFKDLRQLKRDLINNKKESLSLLLDFDWSAGLVSGQKLTNYLEKRLVGRDFSSLKIPLQIVATNLSTGQAFVFDHGNLAQAVRASISVPLIFKPFSYQGKLLIDGGLSNPVPGDLARKMGADLVIGVNLYHRKEFKTGRVMMSNIFRRAERIILYNLAQASLQNCDVVINPDISQYTGKSGFVKYFTKEAADQIILIGEQATDKMMPTIKAKLRT